MQLVMEKLVGIAAVPLVVAILSGPALAQGYVY